IEETVTTRSVEAAVASAVRRLGQSHKDYASWDDAVRSVYGEINQNFVNENYIASTASPVFFDTVYLLDQAGKDVFASRNGEAVNMPAADAFGPLLAEMLKQVPSDGRTYGLQTGMLKTTWGLAAVAVGPIVPNTANLAPPARSRYLIFAKAFDDA